MPLKKLLKRIKNTAMLNPKNIVITGASSGLGEALALRYAAPGVVLGLTGRDDARLDAVALACVSLGATVEKTLIDVTDRDALRIWLHSFDDAHPIDLVIANAGISGGTGGPDSEVEEQVRAIFDVNVTGVFNTIWPILPRMQARKRGQIALMASLVSFTGWPTAPAYSASKAAIRMYGEGLRGSLIGSGVCVSIICPGFVVSRMTAGNDYPMPFLMSAEKAATIMVRRLARGEGRIAYPWPTYGLAGLIGLCPPWLCDLILTKLPKKSTLRN
jgi:short-subunit dehydrogenase